MKLKELDKRKKMLLIIGILLVVCVVIGTSFAWWTNTASQTSTNKLISNCLETEVLDDLEFGAINIDPAYPLTDMEASTMVKPYKFTVRNKCKTTLTYDLSLEILDTPNRLLSEYIAMEFSGLNNGNKVLLNTVTPVDATYKEKNEDGTIKENGEHGIEGRLLDSNITLGANETKEYQIKLWMDEHVTLEDDAQNKTFKSKIVVNSSLNYVEKPNLNLGEIVITQESIEIPFDTSGSQGEEITTTCKYGLTEDNLDQDGRIEENKCYLEDLEKGTTYYYEIKTTSKYSVIKKVTGSETTKLEKYKEEILSGNDPVIKEGLVPVIIGENGAVTKANKYDEWYNYQNKKWANAVILTDDDTYYPGDTIPEDEIESYFVWIPKYDYKIQTLETSSSSEQKAFEIRFSSQNTSDSRSGECTTPSASTASTASGNCQVGDYMTHPAFINFKDGIKGIWVGKFETTGTISAITVKPNVNSLRSQTVSAMHNAAIGYKSNLNSHMMKNTEWGAVAYLTNSNYGRCTNGTCTEISQNTTDYKTGKTGSTTYFSGSVLASTTGNYSGIYDMSGGAWEYVMGNNNNVISNAGFSSMPATKYYDKYANGSSSSDYTRRILGDATAETKGWFGDYADFVDSSSPWFIRGGHYGNSSTDAGLFYFDDYGGNAYSSLGFRLVLVE